MKKRYRCILITCLAVLLPVVYAGEHIYNEKLYDKVIVKSVISNTDGRKEPKLIVQSYKAGKPIFEGIIARPTIIYGENLLVITPKDLPINDEMCFDIDSPTCSDLKTYDPNHVCYNPCISGIGLLAYDKVKNIVYFEAGGTNFGTAGGMYFIFSADLKTKKITHLSNISNPLGSSLSPSGKYLATYAFNGISILDVESKKVINILKERTKKDGVERIYYLYKVKWLSDNRFIYREAMRHDKFQDDVDEEYENMYDVPSQKIIQRSKVK